MAHYGYDDVKATIMRNLRKAETVTAEMVSNEIRMLLDAFRAANLVDDIDADALYRDITSQISVWQPDPSVLRDKKHINWLPEWRAQIKWGFWERYLEYLEEQKNWSQNITNKLHAITDSILGDLGNPNGSGSWDRRGMVVGDVQSGKTANYTGLICKAADAGYKLIIVLAGMTNDLRSQTQSRLDSEFLGFESEVGKLHQNGSRIGVGKLEDHGQLIAQPLTYSSKDGDFRAKTGTNFKLGGNPLLLVVKKNTSVLKRILAWVESQGTTNPETGEKTLYDIPLLLLDDEADNASVNTKSEDSDPTAINKAIRKILRTFAQSSYVGYTATPFANIFIMPDDEKADPSSHGRDLFPRNFIYYINPPVNYVGAARVFGFPEEIDGIDAEDHSLPLIRSAEDAQNAFPLKHNKHQNVDALPDSLIEAIHAFIIVCAARRARGHHRVDNSMLIHVTRFNNVQAQVIDLVETEIVNIQRMLEYRTGSQAKALLSSLQKFWYDDFQPTSDAVVSETNDSTLTGLEWDEVEAELLDSTLKIQVRGINGDAGGVLDYADNPNGLHVIAVGGDKLSRGLTLEGLSVSYYIRPAKNYDTLLQMGRWFGYRPGYLDLCRLYTTEELVGWYQHISLATEELKREFRLMELSNLTPEEYGLKVRTHPAGLSITAANKIRHGRSMQVTFSGQVSQTTVFHKNGDLQKGNFDHTARWLIQRGQEVATKNENIIWAGVSAADVIRFLNGFEAHPLCRKADTELLAKYIEKLNGYGELRSWTVMLLSSRTARNRAKIAGRDIGLIQRTDSTREHDIYMLKNANILSPADQYVDLDDDQIDEARRLTVQAWEEGKSRAKKRPDEPSGPFIRAVRPRENGLLLIYPLDPAEILSDGKPVSDSPFIGFAISFPRGSRDDLVEYKVNTTYWQDRYGSDEDDDEF
ncbi:MAG: Z1 domain-containing protein [Aquisalimonadaceae bacterium]